MIAPGPIRERANSTTTVGASWRKEFQTRAEDRIEYDSVDLPGNTTAHRIGEVSGRSVPQVSDDDFESSNFTSVAMTIASAFDFSGDESVAPPLVLEQFKGKFIRVQDDVAMLHLESANQEEYQATHDPEDLERSGISIGDRFQLRIVDVGGAIKLEFAPIIKRELSKNERDAIFEEIDQSFAGISLGGDD